MISKRDYGIDLLRIILMIFIIMGHLYAHTDIRNLLPFLSSKWLFTWLTQAITVCAVNCYVIITGYYMSQSRFDLYRVFRLWGKVLFYSVTIFLVLLGMGQINITASALIDAFFPLLRNQYWFFTVYLLLFIFIPFLNKAIINMSKRMHGILICIIVIVFYIEPLFSVLFIQYDETEGFSIIAFITLYLIGSYIARCENIKKCKCLLLLSASSVLMVLSKIILQVIVNHNDLDFGTGLLYHNNSIFVLINAVALFMLFKQMELKHGFQKTVSWISPSVFAVYLLHEKPVVRNLLWNEKLTNAMEQSGFVTYILLVIGITIIIFGSSIIVDKVLNRLVFVHIDNSILAKKFKDISKHYNTLIS